MEKRLGLKRIYDFMLTSPIHHWTFIDTMHELYGRKIRGIPKNILRKRMMRILRIAERRMAYA